MNNILQKRLDYFIEKWFLSEKIMEDPILLRKGKVLTYIHFTLITIGFAAYLFSQENQVIPLLPAIFCVLIFLAGFRIFGNLVMSGNLLSLLFFVILAPVVPQTGGLFSDNLLWLIFAPLIALLFANKISGGIWLGIISVFTFYIYYTSDITGLHQMAHFKNAFYYFQSYFFFFLTIYVIVRIFETGQSLIIKMLNEQKVLLEVQKAEISSKNDELEAAQIELKIKNGELENFAFAAAHDLKEPLRMIGMYTKLSQKRMNGHMDKATEEYYSYITGGVDRMQKLLEDLLQYSRMGKSKDDIKRVDLNNIIFVVIHNLLATMKDTEASITINQLPVVDATNVEMIQLFQNLIANSIKFRKPTTIPEIQINAAEEGESYVISLKDNGIGIKKEFQERVFAIFERAHARHEYEGSGIGLATCKKIVEGTGGKIWLNSTEGEGTTFFFTFPKPGLN